MDDAVPTMREDDGEAISHGPVGVLGVRVGKREGGATT